MPISAQDLKSYQSRPVIAGRRLRVCFDDGIERRLDLLFLRGAATRLPLIALVDRPEFLTWPHIERDGVLCLVNEHDSFNIKDVESVLKNLLGKANNLINKCISGELQDEFHDEANSYWDQAETTNGSAIFSLVKLDAPSREIYFWSNNRTVVCGDNEREIQKWVKNWLTIAHDEPIDINKGVFLWLEQPLLPNFYPVHASDIFKIVEEIAPMCIPVLEQAAKKRTRNTLILLGADTNTGPFCGGIIIPPPISPSGKGRSRDPISNGFRQGKVTLKVLTQRYFGAQKIVRKPIDRIESEWVHGRYTDSYVKILIDSKVVILGCGSIGGHVAAILAQSGVGELILVDPDILNTANISRHPLGAQYIRQSKSEALAQYLLCRFPHLKNVKSFYNQWEQLNDNELSSLLNADLIISTIGNIGAELALNSELRIRKQNVPIIYGWLEAFACASHAVALQDQGACFRCGLSDDGTPKIYATEWKVDTTIKREPACGAMFQPYGAIELQNGVQLVSGLAIDVLLGKVKRPTHRIHVENKMFLIEAGGVWTKDWLDMTRRDEGGFTFERQWPIDKNCPEHKL